MFIVSLSYKTDIATVEKHLEAHIDFINKYYATGHFIASGRKVPRTGGVILVKATSLAEVNQIVKEDPFYLENVANFEITEFVPTKTSAELTALKEA